MATFAIDIQQFESEFLYQPQREILTYQQMLPAVMALW